ncbi:MAG: type II/IV secretion system protein [Candidatus Hydrogenedentes bacterium]|nr:type II/IV secretion system protein [Candidatus Hydrogenedentota bacterium]
MPHLRVIEKNGAGGPGFAEIERALAAMLDSSEETGAVDAVDAALASAVELRATDVYFEPWDDCTAMRFRIDGILHDVARVPKVHHARIVARIKIVARMVTYHKDTPQDGRIDADATRCGRVIRVSAFPTVNGERIVLRIMDGGGALLDLDALGFDTALVRELRALIERPHGAIFLTGPSSSGKTTTIYALLHEILARRSPAPHVVTIEDPVERRIPRVSQTEIAPHHGLTFAAALRSLLRQDPEVIMVGEVRDAETAQTAIQAGLTGHLVVSTIHSGTSAGVFARLLDMGVEPYLAASSVSGVLAQRLVRMVCPNCAEPYEPEPGLVAAYGLADFAGPFRRGRGCDACQGIGYKGRTAVGELLRVDEPFAERVLARVRTSELHDAALASGMRPLAHAAAQCVRDGVTTLEELKRVLPQAGG